MKIVALQSIARMMVIIAMITTVSGCATTGPAAKSGPIVAAEPVAAEPDWDALFTTFAGKDTETPSPQKERVAALFSANKQTTADAVIQAITTSGYPRAAFGGACDAAGYIKATECLPALESRLIAESDWFLRYACANAIDSIDEESSKKAVISALDTETNALVAMLCAMYLSRHPVPDSRDLLERKQLEFSAHTDESSVIACLFLEDAIFALNAGN